MSVNAICSLAASIFSIKKVFVISTVNLRNTGLFSSIFRKLFSKNKLIFYENLRLISSLDLIGE